MLKYAYIGRENISSKDDVYDVIATAFRFPDYFGRNLDAMYDCLTESAEDKLIILSDNDYLRETLGVFYDAFIKVIHEVVSEDSSLRIREL